MNDSDVNELEDEGLAPIMPPQNDIHMNVLTPVDANISDIREAEPPNLSEDERTGCVNNLPSTSEFQLPLTHSPTSQIQTSIVTPTHPPAHISIDTQPVTTVPEPITGANNVVHDHAAPADDQITNVTSYRYNTRSRGPVPDKPWLRRGRV